jgi:DNA-binding HxlR family transcriptional regulator
MRGYGQFCALARALDRIGQRWSLLIVRELMVGPRRFTDLKQGLPGIATNLLADRLTELQAAGLVERRELPPPASSAYALTPDGEELREVVDALIRWGGRFMRPGPADDAFRLEWLILALSALGVGRSLDREIVLRLDTTEGVVDVLLQPGEAARLVHGRQPDLTIHGEPSVILGLAAGELSTESARPALRMEPSDDVAEGILGQLFAVRVADASTETPPARTERYER